VCALRGLLARLRNLLRTIRHGAAGFYDCNIHHLATPTINWQSDRDACLITGTFVPCLHTMAMRCTTMETQLGVAHSDVQLDLFWHAICVGPGLQANYIKHPGEQTGFIWKSYLLLHRPNLSECWIFHCGLCLPTSSQVTNKPGKPCS